MKVKQLFSTRKAQLILIIVLVLGIGCAIKIIIGYKRHINSNEAMNIAMLDAGIKSNETIKNSAIADKEHGTHIYKIQFQTNKDMYEYIISYRNGDILRRQVTSLRNETNSTADAQLEKAKEIAVKDAKLTISDVSFTKTELEINKNTYDIEFTTSDAKYEYTIEKDSGKVVDKKTEKRKITNNEAKKAEDGSISLETAKKKALEDAKVSSKDASFIKEATDWEDGIQIYDIEFIASGMKYEYEINTQNGAIHKRSNKISEQGVSSRQKGDIGVNSAKAKALQHAGLSESEVTFTKSKFDHDDGRMVYEIEFMKGAIEYEYKVDASSGIILKYDMDM